MKLLRKVFSKIISLLLRFVLCCTQQNALLGNFNLKKSGGARAPPGPNDATPMGLIKRLSIKT